MGGMQQPGMGMGMGGMMPGQGMGGMPGMSQPQQSQAPPAPVAVAGVQPSVVPPAQEKVDIMDIPWEIPLKSRAGYMAQFQANDKAKTGQLAAVQAKNLLLGTGLAQQTLAGVWNLADIDKDGKLNTFHAPEHVEAACRRSLDDLGLEYLDLYLIHFPISLAFVPFSERYPPEWVAPGANGMKFAKVPVSSTWAAMEKLVEGGT